MYLNGPFYHSIDELLSYTPSYLYKVVITKENPIYIDCENINDRDIIRIVYNDNSKHYNIPFALVCEDDNKDLDLIVKLYDINGEIGTNTHIKLNTVHSIEISNHKYFKGRLTIHFKNLTNIQCSKIEICKESDIICGIIEKS